MRLRVFFTVLISDSLAVMLSMFYAALLVWLIEKVVPISGVYYWLVLGVFLSFCCLLIFITVFPAILMFYLGGILTPKETLLGLRILALLSVLCSGLPLSLYKLIKHFRRKAIFRLSLMWLFLCWFLPVYAFI